METCIACGALTATVELLPSHDDDGFGIPITIKNAVLRHHCESCGMDGIEIPDTAGLIAAVAAARILCPVGLVGAEIRAIRKACEMNGVEFAKAVGVANATLSRWENSEDCGGRGEVTERDFRDAVWSLLYQKVPALQVEPGHFRRMNILHMPVGQRLPRLVLERVRLKDPVRHTKSDEWDIYDQAA